MLGDNGSDYASMGSGEFDSDGMERENDDTNKHGKHYETIEYGKHQETKFKSAFAKQLNEKISHNYHSDLANERFSKSQFDEILDKTLDFKKAQEDFLRVKQENARLKFEIEKHKHEEERFNKLQLEIEHLTCKLSKMEQSRHVYEDASSQLGYFVELFSNQLAVSPYGTELGAKDVGRRRSRTMVSEEESLSSIASFRSRRKSTSCSNTQKRNKKISQTGVPALRSISTDCASDTSSVGQAATTRSLPRYRNRRAGREEKFRSRSRTLDYHSSKKKVDVEDVIENDSVENVVSDQHGEGNVAKKKSHFEILLLRLKTFLLKENKYDLRKDSYKEHSSTLSRSKEAKHKKSSR